MKLAYCIGDYFTAAKNVNGTKVDILVETSIDVLPSKNQALSEYCIHVSKLKHC